LGWFALSDDCQKSEIERLGIGISIYFKSLKVFMIAFLIIFVLNGALAYFFFSYQSTKKVFSPLSILAKFSIGNIATLTHSCIKVAISSIYSSSAYTFNINCANSGFNEVTGIGFATTTYSETANSDNCLTYSNDMPLDLSYCGDLLLNPIQTYVGSICSKGMTSCSASINTSQISAVCSQSTTASNMYFSYSCYGKYYNYYIDTGSDTKGLLTRELLIYVLIGVDAVSMIILFSCLIIILKSSHTASNLLNTKIKRISHFTVRITGLNLIGHAVYEEMEKLVKHIDNVILIII